MINRGKRNKQEKKKRKKIKQSRKLKQRMSDKSLHPEAVRRNVTLPHYFLLPKKPAVQTLLLSHPVFDCAMSSVGKHSRHSWHQLCWFLAAFCTPSFFLVCRESRAIPLTPLVFQPVALDLGWHKRIWKKNLVLSCKWKHVYVCTVEKVRGGRILQRPSFSGKIFR